MTFHGASLTIRDRKWNSITYDKSLLFKSLDDIYVTKNLEGQDVLPITFLWKKVCPSMMKKTVTFLVPLSQS